MAFCSKCGNEVHTNEKFCSKCGNKIESLSNQQNTSIQKEYVFNDPTMGGKTIIKLGEGTLTIARPGIMAKFSHGFSGEKTILFNQISAIQIKKAGIARGYIQFIMSGTKEGKSGVIFGDSKNENIVYFASTFNNNKTNSAAEEIKRTIEQYNLNANKISSTNVVKEDDKYDKLAKLKQLLDNNVISNEEFEKEKAKLLND